MSSNTWIQTYTGKAFDLDNPRSEDVCIADIAHALSMLCRFTGHCSEFYSVAQHSVIVARIVRAEYPELGLAALLHDASEAYLGDWSSPLKQVFRTYYANESWAPDDIEEYVQGAINVRFRIARSRTTHDCIKAADLRALATERRDLMSPLHELDKGDWFAASGHAKARPLLETINPMSPRRAEAAFLAMFAELGGK